MNIGTYLQLGNTLKGVYNANQQSIVNQQNQQRINDLLANDALGRQVQQQKLQDYLTSQRGAGAYYRALAQPDAQGAAAPGPGQNSAQNPFPVGDPASTFPQTSPNQAPQTVPMPGAASMPQQGPTLGVPGNPYQIPPAVQQRRDAEAVRIMQQELMSQQRALQTAPPQQAQSIQGNIAALQREIAHMSQGAGAASGAPAPQGAPTIPTPTKADAQSAGLSLGTYGKVLAMAQHNQVLNLAAQAAHKLLTANPNMTDRQLALAMQSIYPQLNDQSKGMLQLAGLSNTEFFKGINAMFRQMELQGRFGGAGAYTPEQIQGAMDAIRSGQGSLVPSGLRIAALNADPTLGQQAVQGKARAAAAVVEATGTPKAQAAAKSAAATAPVKAVGTALANNARTLSVLEPAYQALHTNFAALIDSAKQYGLGPATPINTLLNKMRQMGDPNYTKYSIFMTGVQKEFGKILSGSTGARGTTVQAMKEAEKTLSPNMTLGQLQAAEDALITEGGNVLDSLKSQNAALQRQLQGGAQPNTPSSQDQEALAWANAHPNDPRAIAIKQHLQGQ